MNRVLQGGLSGRVLGGPLYGAPPPWVAGLPGKAEGGPPYCPSTRPLFCELSLMNIFLRAISQRSTERSSNLAHYETLNSALELVPLPELRVGL